MSAHIRVQLADLLLQVLDLLVPGVQLLLEVGPQVALEQLLLAGHPVHGLVNGDFSVQVLLFSELLHLLQLTGKLLTHLLQPDAFRVNHALLIGELGEDAVIFFHSLPLDPPDLALIELLIILVDGLLLLDLVLQEELLLLQVGLQLLDGLLQDLYLFVLVRDLLGVVLGHQPDLVVQLLYLPVLVLDHLLQPLLLGVRELGVLLLLLGRPQQAHGGQLHLGTEVGDVLLPLVDDACNLELQLPYPDLQLGYLDFEVLPHLGLLLDFGVDLVPAFLDDLLLGLQVLGHGRQLVLVVLLQRVDVGVAQVGDLHLEGLVLLLFGNLLALDEALQVVDLHPKVVALPLVLEPQVLDLDVQLGDLVTPSLVQLGQLGVLAPQVVQQLLVHGVIVVELGLGQVLHPLGLLEDEGSLEGLQLRDLVLQLALLLVQLVDLGLRVDVVGRDFVA